MIQIQSGLRGGLLLGLEVALQSYLGLQVGLVLSFVHVTESMASPWVDQVIKVDVQTVQRRQLILSVVLELEHGRTDEQRFGDRDMLR